MSKRLLPIVCAAVLAIVSGAAAAADDGSELSGNAYAWSLAVSNGGQCEEEWRFGADGLLTITSGQEVTTHAYAVTPAEGSTMVVVKSTRLTSNGLPDCQGNADASVGQMHSVHLQFRNDGGFFTCGSTDTMSCYGAASLVTRP